MRRRSSGSDTPQPAAADGGDFILLNGQRVELEHHPTDFSVIGSPPVLEGMTEAEDVGAQPLSANITRVRAANPARRDELMEEVRRETVAHHIYRVPDTGEEIAIDNRIFLRLRHEDPAELEAIIQEYQLEPEGRMGDTHVLRVTEATGRNPLKTANAIAQRESVESCTPEVLVPMERHQGSLIERYRLFRHQWYLASELNPRVDLDPRAGIQAPEAWRITFGSPEIVIAVIDDGFDLTHPAFRNKRIHPARRDFAVLPQDVFPLAEGPDYHGTCVASIATGSLDGDGMLGVAPGCTFLPIRIGFGPTAAQVDLLEVFRYASRHADVVNCSFGTGPSSFDRFDPGFRQAITELTRTGGRRGKGLVMVFSAGNDDAPTFLPGAQNRNGVRFVRSTAFGSQLAEIPAGRTVFSGYPMTRGVIVVGAMTSLQRKSGYSSWGPHLTVTAPSNNMHYIMSFISQGVNDGIRNQFVANYRGLGQVAAVNRPGRGQPFSPLLDDLATPDFRENFYTGRFGGTSGAAPVVTGVAALMLSVNPELTAQEVQQILMATADQDLDATLDLVNDPNTQGLSGAFVNRRSLFFGAGKVNARRAVERARALLGPMVLPEPVVIAEPVEDGAEPGLPLDDITVFRAAAQPAWNDLPARHLRTRGRSIIGIVLHDTAGNGGHGDTLYLANPQDGRVVSVDFTVERNGSIWKLNPQLTQFCCLHAGRRTAWRGLRNHAVNQATVGIEITQHRNLSLRPLYPLAQVKSVARLCAWLVTRFQLQASDITSHRAIITDGSRSDPRRFPFEGEEGFWFFFWQALGSGERFLASMELDGMDPEARVEPAYSVPGYE